MGLTLVGVSHRTAPVAVRERIAFQGAECASAVTQLLSRTDGAEAVLVSTCNRTEFYVVGDAAPVPRAVETLLSARLGEDLSLIHI